MIDPEFQSQIPALTEDEFRQLEENILSAGEVISPLIVWGQTLVDGHNRYEILQKHPEIPYSVRSIDRSCETREEVLAWICKHQLGRRNLTPEQKKFLIGKQYNMEKFTHGGNRGNQYTQVASSQVDNLPRTESTLERIARECNVSPSYVARAEHFMKTVELMEKYHPGIQEEILSGKLKLSRRDGTIIDGTPKDALPLMIETWRNRKLNGEKAWDDDTYEDLELISKIKAAKEDVASKISVCSESPQPTSASPAPEKKESTMPQTIRERSEEIESVDHVVNEEEILCEIRGASTQFMYRLGHCIGQNPDLLNDVVLESSVIDILQEVYDCIAELIEQHHQHVFSEPDKDFGEYKM